jgi:alkylated DNA repair dioxygenase AlkB
MSVLAALKKEKQKLLSEKSKLKAADEHPVDNQCKSIQPQDISRISTVETPVLAFLDSVKQHSLHFYRLENSLSEVFYVPDCISESYENYLSHNILSTNDAWVTLKTRKLQCWGQDEHDAFSNVPPWLLESMSFISDFCEFPSPINHVLINHYEVGQGILHHTDGPQYLNRVAIMSLGSSVVISFRHRLSADQIGTKFAGDVQTFVLQPRSLFIFSDSAYEHYMHGIEATDVDIINGLCANINFVGLQVGDEVNRFFSCLKYFSYPIQINRGRRISLTLRHKYASR